MPVALNERISDFTWCPVCVVERRLGNVRRVLHAGDWLFGMCRHTTKWQATRRALPPSEILDLSNFADVANVFACLAPIPSAGGWPRETGSTNGVFIAATLAEGFEAKAGDAWPSGLNVRFNISAKTWHREPR